MSYRLNPRALSPYRVIEGSLLYAAGKLDAAVSVWESLRADNRDLITPRLYLAAHYNETGDIQGADQCVEETLAVNPELTLDYACRLPRSPDSALREALRERGLR